jgi:predicted DCC family thiol-disulfide oxidoreductase YuxK
MPNTETHTVTLALARCAIEMQWRRQPFLQRSGRGAHSANVRGARKIFYPLISVNTEITDQKGEADMPRHMIWGERRRRTPLHCPTSSPLAPISGDPRRSRHVALTVFYNGTCPACRRSIERYQAASAGRSRLIAWCDAAAAPWALKRWHVEPGAAVLHLHVVDADGGLLAGAAALARLWRELPGYRWAGLLIRLPGIGLLADGCCRLHLAVNPAHRDLGRAIPGARHA